MTPGKFIRFMKKEHNLYIMNPHPGETRLAQHIALNHDTYYEFKMAYTIHEDGTFETHWNKCEVHYSKTGPVWFPVFVPSRKRFNEGLWSPKETKCQ